MKFKRTTIPRCPQLSLARATFAEANRLIRDARLIYKAKCHEASVGLRGNALLRLAYQAASRMKKAGMYAEITPLKDVMWSLIRYFHSRDMTPSYGTWRWWLEDRRIPISRIDAYVRGKRAA